jgi:hypothetical protein
VLAKDVLHQEAIPVEEEEGARNDRLNIVEEEPDMVIPTVEEAPNRLPRSVRNDWRQWTYSDARRLFFASLNQHRQERNLCCIFPRLVFYLVSTIHTRTQGSEGQGLRLLCERSHIVGSA